jgi:tRNA-Thr(GGU) m(6)t(6)A37 methyltransferase TsaA
MMEIKFKPIGVIHSPFKSVLEAPRWGTLTGEEGEIEVFSQYEEGLEGIERYPEIEVIFVFHKSRGPKLKVKPPHDAQERGIFATRGPVRPNPIGLTVMKLLERKGRFLKVKNVDMIDGTPVLDIKPHKD